MFHHELHYQLVQGMQDEARSRVRLERFVREARRTEPSLWLRARARVATWLLARGAQLAGSSPSAPRHTP